MLKRLRSILAPVAPASRACVAAPALAAALILSACTTSNSVSGLSIEKEQGTEENISSLTRVVERNPNNPEAYNVRGSAYGRAGQFDEALASLDNFDF